MSNHKTPLFFLDTKEQDLVGRVFHLVSVHRPEEHGLLTAQLERLARLAALLRDSPSINAYEAQRSVSGSTEALIDLLCRVPDYDLDLHIPTKAVLGQSYLIGKINFLKSLGYAMVGVVNPEVDPLLARVETELGQSIFSKMAEEIFVSIVTARDAQMDVKTRAAEHLFRIWEERLLVEIDDVAPLLEAVWAARHKVRPVLGTLLGTHEVFRLFQALDDPRFLDYFAEELPEEQTQAFEEFLFGLSHEDLGRLREGMIERGCGVVSRADVCAILASDPEPDTAEGRSPQGLYTSYRARKIRANYRAMSRAEGPRKTAEEYVMVHHLAKGLAT